MYRFLFAKDKMSVFADLKGVSENLTSGIIDTGCTNTIISAFDLGIITGWGIKDIEKLVKGRKSIKTGVYGGNGPEIYPISIECVDVSGIYFSEFKCFLCMDTYDSLIGMDFILSALPKFVDNGDMICENFNYVKYSILHDNFIRRNNLIDIPVKLNKVIVSDSDNSALSKLFNKKRC